jgi:hypothetical protein
VSAAAALKARAHAATALKLATKPVISLAIGRIVATAPAPAPAAAAAAAARAAPVVRGAADAAWGDAEDDDMEEDAAMEDEETEDPSSSAAASIWAGMASFASIIRAV